MNLFNIPRFLLKASLKCPSLISRHSITATRSITSDKKDEDMFISDIPNPFEAKPRVCIACKYKIPLDYKNPRLLSQFISSYTGFVYDKHITGLCDAQQKRLITAVKTARMFGYLSWYLKPKKYLRDPKLFDPFAPSRPNPH
ncbi:hypothetical protein JTE90_023206 [Oedothorax gibbosus]|uniref:Mitochondrial ribosomal protein S18C n=1 Tax=Oedothorax gibbosus TaxID=931172 RepID=A0AAV6VLC7_9ARAC|nr:hypothetical protein JTE90_023206 [Oedothorax gibbosus]